MSKFLENLPKTKEAKRKAKRVGRGIGSGKGGHTSAKGSKGQKARTGGKPAIWFEGGQTPLVHRMPYLGGFRNPNSSVVLEVNLKEISKMEFAGETVKPEDVAKQALANGTFDFVKILGKGKLEKPLKFEGFAYSAIAKEKIEAAGGKAQ